MDSPDGFKALQDKVQSALVTTVKGANRLAAEDLPFQRTANPSVGDDLDDKAQRMLALSSKLLKSAAQACDQDAVPGLEDADDVEMHWRKIVDVVDSVLEKADRAMDEFTGVLKRKDAPAAESAPQAKKPKTGLASSMRNANMTKPQLEFERPVDNHTQWKPILSRKPHASLPLDQSLSGSSADAGFTEYKHPYETEISSARYPDRVYESAPPIFYQPVDKTSATWVDTYEGVLDMLKELRKAKEIAIDLEHHDMRTYAGLLSLMQISTREKDWVVDTLKPWRHKLEVLNEVFADPTIVKVFHGAHMDMHWLQRDLGLYVNGLFDTYFACAALGYPQRSLAYLLKRFADFDADKKYQMADWRIRPLPQEMMYYARSDTHYLLYIYDMVRNELIKASNRSRPETDLIEQAVQKSKELSLSRYEGQNYNVETGHGSRGWYNLLLKHPMPLSGQQFAVYKAIWKWRDDMARTLDESTGYVLPNASIADIARHMPPDAKALHALIPPQSFIAKKSLNDVWAVFQKAREEGINEPSLLQFLQGDTTSVVSKRAPDNAAGQAQEVSDDVESGRLGRSQLFGNVPISTQWEGKPAKPHNDYVLLPWQRIVQASGAAAITTSQEDVAMTDGQSKSDKDGGSGKQQATKANETAAAAPDEEFTLKGGRKRKPPVDDTSSEESEEEEDDDDEDDHDHDTSAVSAATTGASSDAEEEIELESEGDIAEERERERKRAKKQKKAAKRAAKDAARATQQANGEAEDGVMRPQKNSAADEPDFADADKAEKQRRRREKKERKAAKGAKKAAKAAHKAVEAEEAAKREPFDYSKATSVLHASRNGSGGQAGPGKRFDPYTKKANEEGLKGARALPPLHGGRSATFKK